MKRILKSDLDKFYTKEEIARGLISKIDFSKFDIVIDPSCGAGAFYRNIPHESKIGIDILPHIDGVVTADFLNWNTSELIGKKILTITNPPFGKQGSLALKFIKKAAEFSDTIAFILPLSFAKDSVKDKIPKNFHLEYEEILPDDSYLLDGSSYSVKCVFQIWKKDEIQRKSINKTHPKGFQYTKSPILANLSVRRVGVYAGKASLDTTKSPQSHYFLILDNPGDVNKIITGLQSQIWKDLTVGPRSISKDELNRVLNKIIES
jgi:hypothetical protein